MLNFLERRSCEVPRLHHGRTSDYVKLHSWISASANKAQKRSLVDWVFWDSRIGPHPSPVHQHPGPQDFRLCPLLAHAAQKGVVRQRAVRVSRDEDALHRESIEHVEKAADVVGVRVADHDAIEGVDAPAAQEVHDVGPLLRSARIDKIALTPGLHENTI